MVSKAVMEKYAKLAVERRKQTSQDCDQHP